MDEAKGLHRRSNGKLEPTPPEIRQCRYCKGKFEVNPQFQHKQFCKESHRKLYWKYGSQSVGKVAERIERDMRKLIAAELAPLRARLDALEEYYSVALSNPGEKLHGVECLEFETQARGPKRGGGAAA